jgi:hypothetical protein
MVGTELDFLLDLFLDDEVSKPVKKKLQERIKIIQVPQFQRPPPPIANIAAQSPSTIAALERHAGADIPQVMAPAPIIKRSPTKVIEVETGNGTRGPKKW